MKIYKFSNDQPLTNLSEVKGKAEFAKAQKGKWYHFDRVYVIKSKAGEGYGLVSLNFFERLARNICHVNYLKKPFEGRSVKIVSAKGLQTPINAPRNLQELESINAKTKDPGFKGESIFVDITSKGGGEAVKVLKALEKSSSKKCHFGVACFVNYSLAAASKADKIIILDYDPVVVKFNRIAREALISSSTSDEFKEKLLEACQKDPEIRQRKFYPMNNLARNLNIEESFLSNEEDFNSIKKLAEENKIHILQGSIYDQKAIKEIAELAKKEGYAIDSLFISNVYDWDSNQKKRQLLSENIQTLSNDQSKIVEVVPYKGEHHVNVVYYKDPQSQAIYDPEILRGKKGVERVNVYPGAPLLI